MFLGFATVNFLADDLAAARDSDFTTGFVVDPFGNVLA